MLIAVVHTVKERPKEGLIPVLKHGQVNIVSLEEIRLRSKQSNIVYFELPYSANSTVNEKTVDSVFVIDTLQYIIKSCGY